MKAIAEGRWNKVKALVYLLTHSFSGQALAILRVTVIQGKDSRCGPEVLEHTGRQVGRFSLCVGTVINRNRYAGCTFLKATAKGAPWGFPR